MKHTAISAVSTVVFENAKSKNLRAKRIDAVVRYCDINVNLELQSKKHKIR